VRSLCLRDSVADHNYKGTETQSCTEKQLTLKRVSAVVNTRTRFSLTHGMTTDNLIETRGLVRRFGPQLAVNDLNLIVPAAGVYGFLGPNGAGKTTAIRMLLGLIRPNAGEVRLFGQSLAKNRIALMRRVGALVESPSLYPHLTGRENLEVLDGCSVLQKTPLTQHWKP
jgi:ABC-type branched-subunit amino acid transport system ATPase component